MIRYTTVDMEIGVALAALSDVGLCALYLADYAADAACMLQYGREGERVLFRPYNGLAKHARAVVEGLAEWDESAWPLDMRGTELQQQVWEHVRTIPRGERMTYLALAHAVGRPNSVRAIASICGQNELAVIVPCHRVMSSRGEISGYRWGDWRKVALLRREESVTLP